MTAPGFAATPGKFDLTVDLLRITFPYIFFISLTALAGGILNTYSRFSVPAVTPALLNLSFIAFALWGAPLFRSAGQGARLGGVRGRHRAARAAGAVPRPHRDAAALQARFRGTKGVWRVLRQMGPAVFGVSIGQVSLVINVIFASFLVTGSVSWLYYADRLMEFPTGLLGVALGTILLPSLARHHADRSARAVFRAARLGAAADVAAGGAGRGRRSRCSPCRWSRRCSTTARSAPRTCYATRRAVIAYSVGLIGLIMVKVLAPGFYARQDIRTPVKIALVTLGLTQVMNFAFIWPFQHAGLALAIGLGACFNAALLLRGLRRRGHLPAAAGLAGVPAQARDRGLRDVGGAVARRRHAMLRGSSWAPPRAPANLTWVVLLGVATYFAALWLLGFRLQDFARRAAE